MRELYKNIFIQNIFFLSIDLKISNIDKIQMEYMYVVLNKNRYVDMNERYSCLSTNRLKFKYITIKKALLAK